jgi:hypothetical protein
MGEAQAFEDGGRSRLCRPGVDVGQAGLHVGDAICVGGGLGLGQQRLALGVGAQHRVDQGDLVAGHLLADAADFPALRHVHDAGIKHHFAADDFEQRGFARAVAPDKADLVAGRDGDGRMFDQGAASDGICDV